MAGTVTLKSGFSVTGLQLPLFAVHRIEDMAVVSDVQINGTLQLTASLTHNFPAGETRVSSALVIGDLQARAYSLLSQQSWTNVWSDTLIGNPTTSQYNATQYPPVVTNRGALQERWALIFTSTTDFRIVGESVGQVGTGTVNADTAPPVKHFLSSDTGAPVLTNAAGSLLSVMSACLETGYNTKQVQSITQVGGAQCHGGYAAHLRDRLHLLGVVARLKASAHDTQKRAAR
nr:hypothetical protein [Ralstonia solanacearum]